MTTKTSKSVKSVASLLVKFAQGISSLRTFQVVVYDDSVNITLSLCYSFLIDRIVELQSEYSFLWYVRPDSDSTVTIRIYSFG